MAERMAAFGAVLYGKDVARLSAFYARVAGLTLVEGDATWSRLTAAGFELIVHAIPPAIAAGIVIASPPERREETPIKLLLPVADLATARAAAAELGGELNGPDLEWRFADLTVCDGHDPEGNVFQLRVRA